MQRDKLYIVIPCFNEEDVLPETFKQLTKKMSGWIANKKISENSKILFVDNGSSDGTWQQITDFNRTSPDLIAGLKITKNCGHQNGLAAGIHFCRDCADFVITMDADLQDDINAVEEMIDKYHDGADIVYGVRSSRKSDSFFKRTTAEAFYCFMNAIGVKLVYNHADFRLMSSRVINTLDEFKEQDLFLRGILPLTGYNSSVVEYERAERFAGESKYTVKDLFSFAAKSVISFSSLPLYIIPFIGFAELIAGLVFFLARSFHSGLVDRFPNILIASLFLTISGVNTVLLGVASIYISKIYEEAKARPRYIVEKKIGMKED